MVPQWHRDENGTRRTVEGTVALYEPPAASEFKVLLHWVVPEATSRRRIERVLGVVKHGHYSPLS